MTLLLDLLPLAEEQAPEITRIRDALQVRLREIPGLEVYDTVPGQFVAPAAVVRRRRGPWVETTDFGRGYVFVVTLFSSIAADAFGQDHLDRYRTALDGDSIAALLEAEPTLGGEVQYAFVSDAEGASTDRLKVFAGVAYLSTDVVIEVGAF